jgi:hypothetical protein
MKILNLKTIAITITAFMCNACDSKSLTEIFMKEKPFSPANYSTYRISPSLIIKVPAAYSPYWDKPEQIRSWPADMSKFPIQMFAFNFYMPDFKGYTKNNYDKNFDDEAVNVVSIRFVGMGAEQPDAPGFYPPNVFKRIVESPNPRFNLEKYENKFGLRCYETINNEDIGNECYGLRDSINNEFILLKMKMPPYESWVKSPQMQANYFTPQYGGLEIIWRTHVKHFSRWQEIDSQIWKFMADWNIKPQTK